MHAKLVAPLLLLVLVLAGCATYQTPGAGVSVGGLSKADVDITEVMKREPAATFPAHIAVVRVEAPGYFTQKAQCFGRGRLCIVTAHEIESDQDFQRLLSLPMVAGAAPIGRMLLPEQIDSVKDLRLAAATLKADMLLVYSIDTRFHVATEDIGPLAIVSLGFFPNKNAHVTATASAALFDVRTGFVYGVAESTATEEQRTTVWYSQAAIEAARLRAESTAFQSMLGEYEKLWRGIAEAHTASR
jgi:hypothetical protein